MRVPKAVVACALLACLAAHAAGAATMYARVAAPVKASASLMGQSVGTLRQGEAVFTTGRTGGYFRISYRGQTGYVYWNKLTGTKPEDVGALLGSSVGGLGIELSEREAGGALRGLSKLAESYVAASDLPEWAVQAVEEVQKRSFAADELEGFLREGGLGEYAGEAPR